MARQDNIHQTAHLLLPEGISMRSLFCWQKTLFRAFREIAAVYPREMIMNDVQVYVILQSQGRSPLVKRNDRDASRKE